MSAIPSRAFTPIRNPIYIYNDDTAWKATPQPVSALQEAAPVPRGVDKRLTSQGSMPPVHPNTYPFAFAQQTPGNVWDLYPA